MNIEELMKDESFAREMEKTQNVSELAELFRQKGVEISEEELQKALDASELDEDDLENVAGGMLLPWRHGTKRKRVRVWDPFRRRWVYIYIWVF